jgi:hypothetical protein
MHRKEREIKAANIASGNKRCWWIYEWMMAYPNRILKRSRSFYEN